MARPSSSQVTTIAGIAALGGFLFGYNTGDISAALLFLRTAFHLSNLMLGMVTGIALAGAGGGAAVAGYLADRFGRRPMLLAVALIFIAGALISAAARSLPFLLGGRLLLGFGVGGASVLTPLYLSEIAPAERRGALVSFNQLAMVTGILVSNIVGFAFAASGAWRWMLVLGGLPGVLLAGGILVLPETPRYLAMHGHADRALAVLQRLRGDKADIDAEMARLRDDLAAAAGSMARTVSMRLPMTIGIGLAVFQQATGINTVIYFAPVIFQAAGLSSASAAILATAGIGVVNVLMTLVAIRLVDRAGRRPLLLAGLLGMGVSLCLLALAFWVGHGAVLGWLTAGSLAAYIGCFAIGLGPVFWLLIAEIFPLAERGIGMAAATSANWLTNLIVAASFLSLLNILGRPGVFLTYAALTGAALVFAWRLVPETKGLTLEAINALWDKPAALDLDHGRKVPDPRRSTG
jgi:SP family galactose:H+ symporter-like MFS transporter